jgi:hypothetical protein
LRYAQLSRRAAQRRDTRYALADFELHSSAPAQAFVNAHGATKDFIKDDSLAKGMTESSTDSDSHKDSSHARSKPDTRLQKLLAESLTAQKFYKPDFETSTCPKLFCLTMPAKELREREEQTQREIATPERDGHIPDHGRQRTR